MNPPILQKQKAAGTGFGFASGFQSSSALGAGTGFQSGFPSTAASFPSAFTPTATGSSSATFPTTVGGSFSAFPTTAARSTLPAFTTTAATGSAFSAFPGTGATGGMSAFQPQGMMAPTLAPVNYSLDDNYKTAPKEVQEAVKDVYIQFIKPAHESFDAMERTPMGDLNILYTHLQKTSLCVMKLMHRLESTYAETSSLYEEMKANTRDINKFGVLGTQQLKKPQYHQITTGGGGYLAGSLSYHNNISYDNYNNGNGMPLVNEVLPIDFYTRLLETLGNKIISCKGSIEQMSEQLNSSLMAVEMTNSKSNTLSHHQRGAYGQKVKVGPQQILALIQTQNETFLKIAQAVAEIHREMDEVRQCYLVLTVKSQSNGAAGTSASADPFEAADRKTAYEKRRFLQKMKAEMGGAVTSGATGAGGQTQVQVQTQPQTLPQAQQNSFNVFAPTKPATGTGTGTAAGGFSLPASGFPSFTAPPAAAAPAAAGASSTGFNMPSFSTSTTAAPTAASSFGASGFGLAPATAAGAAAGAATATTGFGFPAAATTAPTTGFGVVPTAAPSGFGTAAGGFGAGAGMGMLGKTATATSSPSPFGSGVGLKKAFALDDLLYASVAGGAGTAATKSKKKYN